MNHRRGKLKLAPTPQLKLSKQESIMFELFGGRVVGGSPSQLARYSDLFDRMTEVIFLLQPKTNRILECNPAIEKVLGISATEIVGDNFLNWVASDQRSIVENKLNNLDISSINPLSKPDNQDRHFDVDFISKNRKKTILEVHPCYLRLGDYFEVLQVLTKDVTAVRLVQREIDEMNAKLQALSITDEMTGLFNFRYFKEQLDLVHSHSVRYQKMYSIIFCDVDHFKNYNDINGHPAGDEVLKSVAKIFKEQSRKSDIPARYGGEEFVLLSQSADSKKALEIAERLRLAIESAHFLNQEKQPGGKLTISIGVASFPEHGTDLKHILSAADKALYQAKRDGRNRVCIAKK